MESDKTPIGVLTVKGEVILFNHNADSLSNALNVDFERVSKLLTKAVSADIDESIEYTNSMKIEKALENEEHLTMAEIIAVSMMIGQFTANPTHLLFNPFKIFRK
jgi:hypothetical protein